WEASMGKSKPDLRWLARRVSADPSFLGFALATYQRRHRLNEAGIALFLGCERGALVRLALCRRPDITGGRFVEDVQRIAAYAHCNTDRLMYILQDIERGADETEDLKT